MHHFLDEQTKDFFEITENHFSKNNWKKLLSNDLPKPLDFLESGFLLIDKPKDISSTDVLRYLKRLARFKKIGHAGTLDPFANGLLIVLINKATRQSEKLMSEKKVYRGSFLLGYSSDTQDITGTLQQEVLSPKISLEEIQKQTKNFLGKIFQTTPIYSARKIKGKRLYRYARENQQVEQPVKEVEVFSFDVMPLEENCFEYRIVCGKGTYVRTLIHDLGKKLNTGAVVTSLRRETIGSFHIEQAICLQDLQSSKQIQAKLISL